MLFSSVLCLNNVCPPTQLCWGSESRIKFPFPYFESSSLACPGQSYLWGRAPQVG